MVVIMFKYYRGERGGAPAANAIAVIFTAIPGFRSAIRNEVL
jgi:hypothetical protein